MIEPTSLSAVPEVEEALVFEEFFLAHQERLFQALYLLTGDRSEADDLARRRSSEPTSGGTGSARWSPRPGTCTARL
jgi:hypothetical protein